MDGKINEEVLCVLRKNKNSGMIEINSQVIDNPLGLELKKLYSLCDDIDSDPTDILDYIEKNEKIKIMLIHYNFCHSLGGAFQWVDDYSTKIKNHFDLTEELKTSEEKQKFLTDRKARLKEIFKDRELPFSINKTYEVCVADKSILAYSHRESGWAMPKYSLSANFSIQFKTNFGFGRSSYFYTKIRYKQIDIVPFSDWVTYRDSQYDTIIMYSSTHGLFNQEWAEAMAYIRDAYNLSISDENEFVSKYIIDECEKMVKGLEKILIVDNFEFKSLSGKHPHSQSTGHQVVEVRGEKISGALSFIGSIIAFEKVVQVKNFIDRIKVCNKSVQPVLSREIKIIETELKPLNKQLADSKPEYEKETKINLEYNDKKSEYKKLLIEDGNYDYMAFESKFRTEYADFVAFEKRYKIIYDDYALIQAKINALTLIQAKIEKYNNAIEKFFINEKL